MKTSQDGRVTIPQRLRKQFGFHAGTEVEFVELGGQLERLIKIYTFLFCAV
ncbi:AbrB/MazE/SpoVT family DNA-binding domain-containing protein [Leucothrix pacifica]